MASRLEKAIGSFKSLFKGNKKRPKVKTPRKLRKSRKKSRPKTKRAATRIRPKKRFSYPKPTKKKIISVSSDLKTEKKAPEQEIKDTVSTKIDDMMKILEKGPANFSTLSKTLGIPENLVEEWAKILEEENLAEISYVPMGSPVVKLKAKETG
jgi:hypothetical protein